MSGKNLQFDHAGDRTQWPGEKHGRAIIQTYVPDNKVIEQASCQDYEGFFKEEILSRRIMLYPPFCSICAIGFSGPLEIAGGRRRKTFFKGFKTDSGGTIPLPSASGFGAYGEYDCKNKRKIPL